MQLRRSHRAGHGGGGLALARVALVVAFVGGVVGGGVPAANAQDDAWAWTDRAEGLAVKGIDALVVHPTDGDRLYAHVHGLGVAESRDRGTTWRVLAGAPATTPTSHVRITLDPRESDVIYVVVDGRVHRSEDDGATFRDITTAGLASHTWDKRQTDYLGHQVIVDSRKSISLLVGTRGDGWHHGGLSQSVDGGKIWEVIAGTDVPESAIGPDVRWVRRDPKTEKNIAAIGTSAVYFSEKSGTVFKRIAIGGKVARPYDIRSVSMNSADQRDLYLADPRGIWHSKDTGKAWSKEPIVEGDAIAAQADPADKRVFVILWDRGLCVHDKGKTTAIGGPDAEDPGIAGAEPREIVSHPRVRNLHYVVSPVSGLWRSDDDAETFEPLTTSLPDVVDRLDRIAVHAAGRGVILAVGTTGRVYRSTDHGQTWSHVGRTGMRTVDLVAGATEGTWWAAGRRLLKSTDDGASWTVAYEPEAGDDGLVRVVLHGEGLVVAHRQTGRIATSADGEMWTVTKAKDAPLDGTSPVVDFDVDPKDPKHLVLAAATSSPRWVPADLGGSILESWDGGVSWDEVHATLMPRKSAPAEAQRRAAWWNHGVFVRFDPTTGLMVYAAKRRGVLARKPISPDASAADAKAAFTAWVDVSPAEAVRPAVDSIIRAFALIRSPSAVGAAATAEDADPEAATTRWVIQMENAAGATTTASISSADLLAAWETGRGNATPPNREEPPSSAVWIPNDDPGTPLAQLAADPRHPGRLLAVDGKGRRGVIVFEREGMAAVVGSTSEKPIDKPGEKPVAPAPDAEPLAPGGAPAPDAPVVPASPESPAPSPDPAGPDSPVVPPAAPPVPDAPKEAPVPPIPPPAPEGGPQKPPPPEGGPANDKPNEGPGGP